MICKICGVNETDNPDNICDDCKASIIQNEGISSNEENWVKFEIFDNKDTLNHWKNYYGFDSRNATDIKKLLKTQLE